MSAPTLCIPGLRICQHSESCESGSGTYVRNGYIYSSLAGHLNKTEVEVGKSLMTVRTSSEQNAVPTVDSLVTARVTSVNPRFCKCAIFKVGNTILKETFRGQIRKEDVRATEKDRVEMYKCFRPGDVLLAKVLSLGDALTYVLTTAENELGVVIATSESGAAMVPISWCEMQCPNTLAKEHRKVAKVQPQYIEVAEK